MKYLTLLLQILLFSTCISFRQVERVHYKVEQNRKSKVYTFKIPNGYTFYGWSGGYENEKQYCYADSSVFYITKDHGIPTLNYENIKKKEGAYVQRMEADTLVLSGIDIKGLFWKDIKSNYFSYGYSRVPSSKKEMFEKIIKELNSQVQKNKYY